MAATWFSIFLRKSGIVEGSDLQQRLEKQQAILAALSIECTSIS
jgi:hypothetical protein